MPIVSVFYSCPERWVLVLGLLYVASASCGSPKGQDLIVHVRSFLSVNNMSLSQTVMLILITTVMHLSVAKWSRNFISIIFASWTLSTFRLFNKIAKKFKTQIKLTKFERHNSGAIVTAGFSPRWPRRPTNQPQDWRPSVCCCRTTCLESAPNRLETPAVDNSFSATFENLFV